MRVGPIPEPATVSTTPCPNGHLSSTDDFCDVCGASLRGAPGADPSAGADLEQVSETAPSLPAEPCPRCSALRSDSDRFCESCGYDFVNAQALEAAASTGEGGAGWVLAVEADRAYFERHAGSGIDFPAYYPPRRFSLEAEEVAIGRTSASRGTEPQIDLAGSPGDPGVSHLHAVLLRQPDGTYMLLDPGSSNGTTLNDDPSPIAAGVPVALADGDRIHLGAWTTLTVKLSSGLRPEPQGSGGTS